MAVPAALAEAPLAVRLPRAGAPPLPADAVLDRFVAWVSETGLSLYPHQEEAILALLDGKHLVLSTPTGSGKSLVATFLHFKAMAEGKRSFYTCPIKALVNEKFFDLCRLFGPENVGMMTGDAAVNRDAPIVCCTAEILMNLALREAEPRVDAVVMDEFHYYADKERGIAWQVPLLLLEKTTFLLMSATLGDMAAIAGSLAAVTGRRVAEVRSAERPVPLEFEYRETPLHETIEDLVSAGKAPIYLVNFTQRAAAEQAQNLMSANFAS
ncbi:MAG TPA: DEAD/DEAH box helicase, partial [Anaeromyxobacteraceae bacterium]|nr:DEAD/DEAH box helicase [Anaeromyxobacteraceae bacterium]